MYVYSLRFTVILVFVYKIFDKFLFVFRYKCETAKFRASDRRAVSHSNLWIIAFSAIESRGSPIQFFKCRMSR